MNRALIIPALLAGGVHLTLLFGFKATPTPPVTPTVVEETPLWTRVVIPPDVEISPVVNAPGEEKKPPQPLAPGGPSSEEIFHPDIVGDFVIDVPIQPPFRPQRPDITIPDVVGPGGPDGSVDTAGVIDWCFLDDEPRALLRSSPRAPRDFLEHATVTVEFIVGREGRVTNVRVIDSTHAFLEETCLREVRRWRFEPGTRHGVTVAFRVAQTFIFNPRD